ncbi:AP-5 complex subunit zeta-1 [Strongylocentrotus purpuratus]|uniref:AP-5 complex subunit zeta-1 n=1 Tax=Strongylocentrotus purpuratus TaxID=7668 RepID=A0A7M7NSB4_STRPU|nr:AP-5 complex subunit zeta-1 [Strongylocentrotus purpuratus]
MAAPIDGKSVRFLLIKERGLSKKELEAVYNEAHQCLVSGAPPIQCVHSLRKLLLAISCTKLHREIPKNLLRALCIVVLGTNTNLPQFEPISLLCSAVLQEYGPTPQLDVELGAGQASDLRHVPYLLPVILAQGRCSKRLEKLVSQMLKWVSTVGFNSEIQCRALSSLVTTATQHRDLLSDEQIYVVGSQLSDWLSNASTKQATSPHSKQKSSKNESVTEIDGRECQDFFTLLSLSSYYGQDQLLNIHTFSSLRAWLLATTTSPAGGASRPLEVGGRGLPSLGGEGASRAASSGGKFANKARKAMIEKACEYCLRVIDLCHRRPLKIQDQDLIQACLVEAIETLIVICRLDTSLVSKLYPSIKQAHTNLAKKWPRVQLAILQFFLDYSEALHVVFKPEETIADLFGEVITRYMHDDTVTFDTVTFLLTNLQQLCLETELLEKYSPSILRILAWNPRTFLSDYVEILPAMISTDTAKEMLHLLLDLPCTTASLILTHREKQLRQNPSLLESQPSWLTSVNILRKPEHQPWFNYILRSQSGKGDTITKLNFLYKLIENLASHPRVLICSQAIPSLVRLYFKTVLQHADYDLVSQLVPIILERSAILFPITTYQDEMRRVLGDALLEMFSLHPSLVVDQRTELQDFIGALRHIDGKEDFFSHVVWIIGQYTASMHDKRCTMEIISGYYESLETLLYEVSVLVQSSTEGKPPYSIRLMAIMMTTLAKLASRCQDLIPRVILCLTKISQQQTKSRVGQDDKKVLLSRATELVNLLKLPDVASAILSPSTDIREGRWHSDVNASIPLLLKAASQLIQPQAS